MIFYLPSNHKIINLKFFENYQRVQYIIEKQEIIKNVFPYFHYLYNILESTNFKNWNNLTVG